MKKIILYIVLFFYLFKTASAQTNLVPNYSFETLISCPDVEGATFYSYTPPWFSPNLNTPDIFNSCALNPGLVVPNTIIGYQQAHTGQGYGGFAWAFTSGATEYLSVKLNSALLSGSKYCINFFVNPGNYTAMGIDRIGAYISTDSLHVGTYGYLQFIPQIENPAGNIITDTVNWTEISGEYVASGGEQYINIGVFRPDSMIQTSYIDTINPNSIWPYYFLDDVYVYLCDDKVSPDAGNSQSICIGDSIQIGTLPRNEYSYLWQPAIGLSNANIANPMANPVVTTTYTLQQTDFMNEVTYDNITITVNSCEDTIKDDIFIPEAFSPNNDLNNDVFFVRSHNIKEMTFSIYDRWGEKVFESTDVNYGWDGTYKNMNCNTGVFVYYLNATLKDGTPIMKKGSICLVR